MSAAVMASDFAEGRQSGEGDGVMPVERNKMWKRRRLAMRASVQAMVFAVVAAGASSALAQDDSAAAKRKNEYGLGGDRTELRPGPAPAGRRSQIRKQRSAATRRRAPTARAEEPASGAIVDPAG